MEVRRIPKIETYGRYRGEGYGAHCIKVTDVRGDIYWYSYETLVAFNIDGEFHIVKNYWGMTTGKHLNWITTEVEREDWDTFMTNLSDCISRRNGEWQT